MPWHLIFKGSRARDCFSSSSAYHAIAGHFLLDDRAVTLFALRPPAFMNAPGPGGFTARSFQAHQSGSLSFARAASDTCAFLVLLAREATGCV